MPSADYFLQGSPEAARTALAAVLAEHGFGVDPTTPDGWRVARGSATATSFLGAMAGRKNQRLEHSVSFVDHQGTPVVRFGRDGGAGVMGGVVGIARSNDVFGEVGEAVAARLHEQGLLLNVVRGS